MATDSLPFPLGRTTERSDNFACHRCLITNWLKELHNREAGESAALYEIDRQMANLRAKKGSVRKTRNGLRDQIKALVKELNKVRLSEPAGQVYRDDDSTDIEDEPMLEG